MHLILHAPVVDLPGKLNHPYLNHFDLIIDDLQLLLNESGKGLWIWLLLTFQFVWNCVRVGGTYFMHCRWLRLTVIRSHRTVSNWPRNVCVLLACTSVHQIACSSVLELGGYRAGLNDIANGQTYIWIFGYMEIFDFSNSIVEVI